MFCSVHKWFISGSLDTGSSLPALVRRHVDHCRSSKDFAAGAHALGDRLTAQGQQLLTQPRRQLEERITAELPGLIARRSQQPETRKTKPAFLLKTGGSYLRPALAAVFVLIVVSLGVWFVGPGSLPVNDGPTLARDLTPMGMQSGEQTDLKAIGQKVGTLTASIESPLHNELAGLRAAADSMKTFFVDYVDVEEKNNGS